MSNATRLVELEAAIAEAELTDDEAGMASELVGEGSPIADAIALVLADREGGDGRRTEKPPIPEAAPAFVVDDKKVEKEIERHLNRMAELLGPSAEQYEPCEECGAAGIRIPGPQMKANDKYRMCPTCDGYGQVLTGSKAASHVTANCPTCMGRGFQERVAEGQTPAAPIVQPVESGDGFGTPTWMGDPEVKPGATTGWQ